MKSLSITLLDKDGILPQFPEASDRDYHVKPPSELFYQSCCNNFWWCLQNVAKGIARSEVPYAMEMYHHVVREDLHEMISWYIGSRTDFQVSTGKMGKYFQIYLPSEIYQQYLNTYSDSDSKHMWESVFAACDLFQLLGVQVGDFFRYEYNRKDEENMRKYLEYVKNT